MLLGISFSSIDANLKLQTLLVQLLCTTILSLDQICQHRVTGCSGKLFSRQGPFSRTTEVIQKNYNAVRLAFGSSRAKKMCLFYILPGDRVPFWPTESSAQK